MDYISCGQSQPHLKLQLEKACVYLIAPTKDLYKFKQPNSTVSLIDKFLLIFCTLNNSNSNSCCELDKIRID